MTAARALRRMVRLEADVREVRHGPSGVAHRVRNHMVGKVVGRFLGRVYR